ncbi:CASTOR/POLLUX-related putative ion channel [Herbiconiux daphne]|uniref:NAD-binding protein n=1 Tax=Herbiconiux daphne TaxID=2970914 RepID=A0ABT2H152_9MICO|nr:TrkA C-terminal domain-containing protein [Herbiconiux daphne]MCS5733646.1 NAD-binding protein [Herbiconiux daphne]
MSRPGLAERARYRFDTWMSRGTVALMLLLAAATVVFVVVLAVIVYLVHAYPDDASSADFLDVLWGNLMRTLDPGTMGGDSGWGFRALMLVVTVGGLVIVASLIGIVSGAFDSKVDELRKGRSRVLESDHTLILGWSPKVFSLIGELALANESRGRSAIVVLADRDKVEMEDAIRAEVGPTGRTRVICRTGDPMNLHDLELVSPHDARSIVLLASDGDDDPDSTVIKTALALTNNPGRKAGAYHIVGELEDPGNLEAARLVGRDETHWVLASDLISRVTVQTCRQSGLSVVYTELLDFGGDEIYFTEQPSLTGRPMAEIQGAFSRSTVIGMVSGGTVVINPSGDTVLAAGDELIVIAEDDSTIALAASVAPDERAIVAPVEIEAVPEHTLVLGCNAGLAMMLRELHDYVAPGSTVRVVADQEPPPLPHLRGLDVTFLRADVTSRAVLDDLRVYEADHIIVLAAKETLPAQRADARTLITLLHLRDIAERHEVDLNVVSEMLDDRNRELAEVTNADDFIVSEKLVSLMLSQVSENRLLADVFATLFSSQGSEIYLRPAEAYIVPGVPVDFYTVLEAARRSGETAIGYRVAADAHTAERAYGVHVNPPKEEQIAFAAGDRVIVLAEN